MCVHLPTYLSTYKHTHTRTYTYTYTHAHTYTYTHIHKHIYLDRWRTFFFGRETLPVHLGVVFSALLSLLNRQLPAHTHTHTHTHAHTHTHTHI